MAGQPERPASPGAGWTAGQRRAVARYPVNTRSLPGSAGKPYVPETRAQYQALPRGAFYIASDGTISRKGAPLTPAAAARAKPSSSALAQLAAKAANAMQGVQRLRRQANAGLEPWVAARKASFAEYQKAVANSGHPESAMWLSPVERAPSSPPPRYEERVDARTVIGLARQANLAAPRVGERWVKGRGPLEGYYVPSSVARISDDPRKRALLEQVVQRELTRRVGVIAEADSTWDRQPTAERDMAARVRAGWNGALFESFPYAEAAADTVLYGTPFGDNLAKERRYVERDDNSDIPGRGTMKFIGSLAEPSPASKLRLLKRGWDGASGLVSGYLSSDADGADRLTDAFTSALGNVVVGAAADRLVTGAGRAFNDSIGYDPASAALQRQAARLDGTTLNGLGLGHDVDPLGPHLPHLSALAEAAAARRRAGASPSSRYADMFSEPVRGLSPQSLDELEAGLANRSSLDEAIRGEYLNAILDPDGARDLLAEGSKALIEIDRTRERRRRQTGPKN